MENFWTSIYKTDVSQNNAHHLIIVMPTTLFLPFVLTLMVPAPSFLEEKLGSFFSPTTLVAAKNSVAGGSAKLTTKVGQTLPGILL